MCLRLIDLDDNRTSLLLGVVVRARRKRPIEGGYNSKSSKIAKTSSTSRSTPPTTGASSSPSVNYIPTARNSKKKETAAAKSSVPKKRVSESATPSTTVKDIADDLPYSPGQLLNEDDAVTGLFIFSFLIVFTSQIKCTIHFN